MAIWVNLTALCCWEGMRALFPFTSPLFALNLLSDAYVTPTIATLLWDSLSTRINRSGQFGIVFQEEPKSLEPGGKEGEPSCHGNRRKDSREDKAIRVDQIWIKPIWSTFFTHMFPCVAYEGIRWAVSPCLCPIICSSWQSNSSSFLRKAVGMFGWILLRTATGNRRGPRLWNKDAKEAVQLKRGNQCCPWCFRTSCLISLHCSRKS